MFRKEGGTQQPRSEGDARSPSRGRRRAEGELILSRCVREQTKERPAHARTLTHSLHSRSLSLLRFHAARGGNREGKNEEEVRCAARFVSANAGLLMKHRSGHPIIRVTQVALHGNEK